MMMIICCVAVLRAEDWILVVGWRCNSDANCNAELIKEKVATNTALSVAVIDA